MSTSLASPPSCPQRHLSRPLTSAYTHARINHCLCHTFPISFGRFRCAFQETYNYDGTPAQFARRDKRWGKHTGRVTSATESRVEVAVKWDEPHGGEQSEIFEVPSVISKILNLSRDQT